MDKETPVRKGLAAAGSSAKRITGLPESFQMLNEIEATLEYGAPSIIHLEYSIVDGGYQHREFEIDYEQMYAEDAETLILKPQKRAGPVFVELFEQHGGFDVRNSRI